MIKQKKGLSKKKILKSDWAKDSGFLRQAFFLSLLQKNSVLKRQYYTELQ